jgi:hypothetical protein
MTDNDNTASREQCGVCGGLIEEGESREEITEADEIIAFAHLTCA